MREYVMRVVCNKCGRTMNATELGFYLSEYLRKLLAPVLAPIIIEAMKDYWAVPKMSFMDDSMAAIANITEIKCYGCGKDFRTPADLERHKKRKTPCLIIEVKPEDNSIVFSPTATACRGYE